MPPPPPPHPDPAPTEEDHWRFENTPEEDARSAHEILVALEGLTEWLSVTVSMLFHSGTPTGALLSKEDRLVGACKNNGLPSATLQNAGDAWATQDGLSFWWSQLIDFTPNLKKNTELAAGLFEFFLGAL